MVIQAIYENGVFKPIDAIELPDKTQVKLEVQRFAQPDGGQAADMPLSGLAAIAHQYPANDDLPSDSAAQHDHYLYGVPKRA